MKASLIFSSTSHSINVQKVNFATLHHLSIILMFTRSSKSCYQKPSTYAVQFPRSSM